MNADNLIQFAEAMMTSMREYFEKDGRLDPVAFVLATRDYNTRKVLPEPEPMIVPLQFRNQKDKDKAADKIRKIAKRTSAVGVLCGFETWILSSDNTQELERAVKEGLSANPNRSEVLYVMMEHRSGEFVWVCDIKRDEAGKPSLGQFRREEGMNLGGRFENLLPQTTRKFDA